MLSTSGSTLGKRQNEDLSKLSSFKVATKLQYRDGNEDAAPISSRKWWNGMFVKAQVADEKADEQDNVDEYLEFLDRRYKRLHNVETEDDTSTPFSALNWLVQGSPSRNEVLTSQQQEEDALYVLGVAGLASRKLLQKHPLLEENTSTPRYIEDQGAIDVIDADVEKRGLRAFLIKKLLVPVVRVVYVTLRCKDMFVTNQTQRMKSHLQGFARASITMLVRGPARAASALLKVGGGRATISLSLAIVASLVVCFRQVIAETLAATSI